ncbi:MAG: DUF5615 family PIN-like protein [Natrialbaceae archaeon]|nr:DUF5615 family PIN-like protein [Natrialbaceae archaeon]
MSEWEFLLDENIDPIVAELLQDAGYQTVRSTDVLGAGAEDEAICAYASEHSLCIVTCDVSNFRTIDPSTHDGVILCYGNETPGHEMAAAIINLVSTYPSRETMGSLEILDDWV